MAHHHFPVSAGFRWYIIPPIGTDVKLKPESSGALGLRHPIFFCPVLKGVHKEGKLSVADPRRTVSAP
jgi:hypothetical protein